MKSVFILVFSFGLNLVFIQRSFAQIEMPLQHENEAQALDAITGIDNISILLNKKNINRVEIYNYAKNSLDTMGAQCSIDICKNYKFLPVWK